MIESEGTGQLAPCGCTVAHRRRASPKLCHTQMQVAGDFLFLLVPILSCCLQIISISERRTAWVAGRDLHSEDRHSRKVGGSRSGTVWLFGDNLPCCHQ